MFRINRRKIVRAVRRIRILDIRTAGITRTVLAVIAVARAVFVRVAFVRVAITRLAFVSIAAVREIGGELRIPASECAAWKAAARSTREPVMGRVRAVALSARSTISAVLIGGRTGILAGAGTTGEMLRVVVIARGGAGPVRARSGRWRVPVNLFRLLPAMLRIDRIGRAAGSPVRLFSMLMPRARVFLGRSQAGCEQQRHQRQKKGGQYPQCRYAASETFFRHEYRSSKIDAGHQGTRPTALTAVFLRPCAGRWLATCSAGTALFRFGNRGPGLSWDMASLMDGGS